MPRSVSPPPRTSSPVPAADLSSPFDDDEETGTHSISRGERKSEPISKPPPAEAREFADPLLDALQRHERKLRPSQRPTPVRPVSLHREARTDPAPEVPERLRREGTPTEPAPDSSERAADRLPLPESDRRKKPDSKRSEAAFLESEVRRMRDCFADGDYETALQIAEQVLAKQPDHETAQSYSRSCLRLVEQRHVDRIGDLAAVPCLAMNQDQIRWLALDHREGFVLSLIDGMTSIEEIIDIAGMSRVDLLKTIAGLLEAEVLRLR